MKRILPALLLLAVGTAQASTITIDFEEFSGGAPDAWTPIQSNGFDIQGFTREGVYGPDGFAVFTGTNGTKVAGGSVIALGQDSFGAEVNIGISRSDGASFAIYSADFLAETDPDGRTYVIGYKTGGGTVTLADEAFGTGSWLDITSVGFVAQGNGWTFSEASMELDNIVVGAAVPVPAAVWLFGSALGALGWVRRRKAA